MVYVFLLLMLSLPGSPPLTFRFALATKAAAPSVTGTNQGVAQVDAFPLLIYLIVIPVVKTTSCE